LLPGDCAAGLAAGLAAFGGVTPATEGLGAVVFRAAVILAGTGFVVELASLVEPVAGLRTWRWGVLPFGLSDLSFLMISSMISKY
jgi:hypothetical protein